MSHKHKTRQTVYAGSKHLDRTLDELEQNRLLLERIKGIRIGAVLLLPRELAERDEDRYKHSAKEIIKVRFTVVGKTASMLVCERLNGTRECFSYGTLLTIEKKNGGVLKHG